MENNDVSIQIDAREEAGFAVKTDGSAEEVLAALVGVVEIFKAVEKQFGRESVAPMLATFFEMLSDYLSIWQEGKSRLKLMEEMS